MVNPHHLIKIHNRCSRKSQLQYWHMVAPFRTRSSPCTKYSVLGGKSKVFYASREVLLCSFTQITYPIITSYLLLIETVKCNFVFSLQRYAGRHRNDYSGRNSLCPSILPFFLSLGAGILWKHKPTTHTWHYNNNTHYW